MDERQTPGCEAPPTVRDGNRAREIQILQQDFGYVVKVGCQTFAIETTEKLLLNLTEYLKNPQETEKLWVSERKLR